MGKDTYLLFTAGRGPVECAIAVQGIQNRFKSYLDDKNIGFDIINQKRGSINGSIVTIVFKIETIDSTIIKSWVGTLLWKCKSPIRKYHKRKNWFVKCEQVYIQNKFDLDPKNVIVQTYRASGPGGQHRNKVETAVRLTHKSSGIIVTAADCKSQVQNKKRAWKRLIEKLKIKHQMSVLEQSADQWSTQIRIERGLPIRTFIGRKFYEEK